VLALHDRLIEYAGAAVPVPVRVSTVVEDCALLVKVSVAVTAPAVRGLNVIVNAALLPAAIVAGSDSPPTVNAELLLLTALTVTVDPPAVRVPEALPLAPTTTLPRARVAGLTPSVPPVAVVPIPESRTVTVEFEAVELIVIVAVRVPVVVGVNVALIVQLDPGASVLSLQVPVPPQLKSPADIGLPVIVNGAFPVFDNVVSRIGLVTPTLTLPKLMVAGFSVRMPAAAVFTVTVALADLVLSATLVAFTVTVSVAVTIGAVNSPVVVTVPAVTDQVTAVLLVFVI
jgi:hypothetical protein